MTKIGTLKELGVKPGDVVEYPGVAQYEVMENGDVISIGGRRIKLADGIKHKYSGFRIISRSAETLKLWCDMTPEEKGALLLAHHEGKDIEFINKTDTPNWKKAKPLWADHCAYRIKPERTKSDWSAWFVSKQDGTTKLNLDKCADVERVALGDGPQFAYRVKKWVY